MLEDHTKNYYAQRAKIVGAVKSADILYDEKNEFSVFATHYFNRNDKEVMYIIHDIISVMPDSEVYLRERTWGIGCYRSLVNWQTL